MEKVYARTKGIRDDMVVGFCPGCMHGTVFKLIGEVLEELGVLEKTITVHGVGCCGLAMEYVTYDCTTSPHGRDPHRDSVKFRRKATELSIPTITAMDTARVLVDALRGDHDISQMELVDIAHLHREAAKGE